MNAPATVAPLESGKLAANQTVIRGRIIEVIRTESAVRTDLTLPAPDQYSQPASVRILSNRLLGKPGEDITQRCLIKGYRRKYTDKQGQPAFSVDMTLSAIED